MSKSVFFSFNEEDRGVVLTIKGRATNSSYYALNFEVQDLHKQWGSGNDSVIKQTITKNIQGTSRTIVFVGEQTHKCYWVPHEVHMTLAVGKPVYAIRLSETNGKIPECLLDKGIRVYAWSEEKLQELASK